MIRPLLLGWNAWRDTANYSVTTALVRLRGRSTSTPWRQGHVVGEELEWNDLGDWQKRLRRGGDGDGVGGERRDGGITSIRESENAGALALHIFEERDGLVVAEGRLGVGGIDCRQDDQWDLRRDQGVGPMFEFAGGVALGVQVGGLLELKRAFACDGVMDASAQIEECSGVGVERREGGNRLLPGGELRGYGAGDTGEGGEEGFDLLGRNGAWGLVGGAAVLTHFGCEQSEDSHERELRGEAFGGGDGQLHTSECGQVDIGFAGHGRVRNIGDGDGWVPAAGGFAQRGQRVRGLAGLGENKHGAGRFGMAARGSGAACVFAGIFHIDDQAGEVLEENLCRQPGMAA